MSKERVNKDFLYYYISETMGVIHDVEIYSYTDDIRFYCGNYFQTEAEAREIRDKIVKLLNPKSDEREI